VQPLTFYSEQGCLLCREAEGTLRLLLGDAAFERNVRLVKMTFDLELQAAFKQATGSATIPKLYRGDFRNGAPLAKGFDEIMALVASGEIHGAFGQDAPSYPAAEEADALVLGAGPGGLAAYQRLVEGGYAPLVVSESVGGKLLGAQRVPNHKNKRGRDVIRALLDEAPGVRERLRPGVTVEALALDGARKTVRAGGRTYSTHGPLVLALGVSLQHLDVQIELDFLGQGLHCSAAWVDLRGQRVAVSAPRGRAANAYADAQRLSRAGNDVTLIAPDLTAAQRTTLEELFAVSVLDGRVDEVRSEGTPPRVTGAQSGERAVPADWFVWSGAFRSRGKPLFKDAFGTAWLRVDRCGRVLNAAGRVVPGVYGVGDAIEEAPKTLEIALSSAERLGI